MSSMTTFAYRFIDAMRVSAERTTHRCSRHRPVPRNVHQHRATYSTLPSVAMDIQSCCTCASLLSSSSTPAVLDEKHPAPRPKAQRHLQCCGRLICEDCIQARLSSSYPAFTTNISHTEEPSFPDLLSVLPRPKVSSTTADDDDPPRPILPSLHHALDPAGINPGPTELLASILTRSQWQRCRPRPATTILGLRHHPTRAGRRHQQGSRRHPLRRPRARDHVLDRAALLCAAPGAAACE